MAILRDFFFFFSSFVSHTSCPTPSMFGEHTDRVSQCGTDPLVGQGEGGGDVRVGEKPRTRKPLPTPTTRRRRNRKVRDAKKKKKKRSVCPVPHDPWVCEWRLWERLSQTTPHHEKRGVDTNKSLCRTANPLGREEMKKKKKGWSAQKESRNEKNRRKENERKGACESGNQEREGGD